MVPTNRTGALTGRAEPRWLGLMKHFKLPDPGLLGGLAMVLLAGFPARAETVGSEQTLNGKRLLVLENDHVRMVVAPDPGGTVVEFTQKKTGVNHVYGGQNVLDGRPGSGWKDYYFLEAPERLGAGVFTLPYEAEFRTGPGYKAIYVTCTAEQQKFERELRLADDSAELTTISRITNVGDKPRRLQIRWHTHSTLDDQLAENSCIIAPGEGGQARKCFIGSGYDHQFIVRDGYWMAVNYKGGSGMWITFKKEQNCMQITWTDYNHARKAPSRGAYIAEPHPQAILAKPGESVVYESTFFPFTAENNPETIPLGVLRDPREQERARAFLSEVLRNLEAIGPFTMTPGAPPAGIGDLNIPNAENRFSFSHRRRDRFALQPWGMLDAMFELVGVQEKTVRARYYARLFNHVQQPMNVSFRFVAYDANERIVKEQVKEYSLGPDARELDVRDDIVISDMPDGSYRFVVEGLVEGQKLPIHSYVDHQRLVGQARPIHEKKVAEREAAPLAERPFVKALREVPLTQARPGEVTVPIGVEDGSGIARTHWPVRLGVPFAQGVLPREATIELIAPDGKPVLAQIATMATWLDGSLKWLLVDFQADVPADSHVFYTLRGKLGPTSADAPLATMKDNVPVFTAGPLAGAAADKLLGLFGSDDLWWSDGEGRTYHFRVQGEDAALTIEENGPNRAVIKAVGWYYDRENRPVCMGELRLEYARGQSFVTLYHTVTFAGDPWAEKLGSFGLHLQLRDGGYESATVALDGKTIVGTRIGVQQPSPEGANVLADGTATVGRRSNGSVSFHAAGKPTVAVYHREFWQMAPKKFVADADAGTVTYSYWPTEAGAMSFLPREYGWIPNSSSAEAIAVGMGRTHEIIIDFEATRPVTDFDTLHDEPVVAIVPPRYLASTRSMLHLSPYEPERHPVLEKVISDTIDHFIDQRDLWCWYGQWFYGGIPNFFRPTEYKGWNFGRYAWILNEQDIVQTPWLCYHRSGDRKYLKFARSNTRHLMEVATIRWNPVWPQWVGFSRRHHECIWLGSGDAGHSMLDPYLDYYYATGYRPARDAAERLAEGMTMTTSGSWRYISNPVAGLTRMYLDTQNPRYKEHADRIWNTLCYPDNNSWWAMDHADRMVMWYSQINPRCLELWKAWALNPDTKDRFNGVDSLTMLFQMTGDKRYALAALKQLPTSRQQSITQHVLAGLRAMCYAGELPKDAEVAGQGVSP